MTYNVFGGTLSLNQSINLLFKIRDENKISHYLELRSDTE